MSTMDIDTSSSKPQPRATEINNEGETTNSTTPSLPSASKNASTPVTNTNTTNNTTTTKTDDPDPIVATYDVYTNAPLADNRKLLVLQYPNKQGPLRGASPQFSEVRLKTKSGFVEVDVPAAHGHADYDRDKGMRWGGALARSTAAKNGGTHGLAGGFGVGVPARSAAAGSGAGRGAGGGAGGGGAGARQNDWQHEISMMDWSEAVRQDKVIRTQTLGGQFAIEKETNCRWMVGVFKGDQLHLTPATSLIHLRPQLHHLDAYAEQERLSRPREGSGAGPSSSAAAGGPAAAGGSKEGQTPQAGAAKAIHMTIKSAGQGDGGASVDTMVERLRKVQTEPWTKLRYEHDDSDKSWSMFASSLVYADAPPPNLAPGASNAKAEGGVGKGKEKATAKDNGDEAEEGKKKKQQQMYKAQWAEDDFLKAVSGLSNNQQGDAKPLDDEVEIKAEVFNQGSVQAVKKAPASAAKGKGKAVAAPAAASAAKKPAGIRGKSVAFKE
ncbi:uncharacterized protein F4807DRAFT_160829 [Annulohypoxylon truncatum]|uniref:uncharacterized protein n=1 Tax=Annulohypoxylon truncatum TaxID=327061 RepID=UPI0020075A03|nr:uncharacterized protein F4807DRAFT_160829 [Annulohypoxylon truncatum]KAI1207974.1 hypothetical protein F4807DRAFT_160829 [Annulohypoxylon truncatum]